MNFLGYTRYAFDARACARSVLDFHPDPIQSNLLTTTASRCILNCTRQWGKSTINAIKAPQRPLQTRFANLYPQPFGKAKQ